MNMKQTCPNTGRRVTTGSIKDAEVADWGTDVFWWECPLCQGWHLAIRHLKSGLEEIDVPANTTGREQAGLALALGVLERDDKGIPDNLMGRGDG